MKQIHAVNMSAYERLYLAMQVQAKQEQARVNAQQMAGVAAPSQASPTKMMQPSNQQNQFPFQQGQKGPPQSQATPVQAHAQLPQNGMTTPQQQQMMQHRRNSSVRKPEQMTPQPMGPGMTRAITSLGPESAAISLNQTRVWPCASCNEERRAPKH